MARINNPSRRSELSKKFFGEGLTFDDVLLMPSYSQVLPRQVNIQTKLTRDISLEGMGLIQSVSIAGGEHLLISLPGPRKPLVVKGVVRHSRELADGVWCIGILFVAIESPDPKASAGDSTEVQRIAAKILD